MEQIEAWFSNVLSHYSIQGRLIYKSNLIVIIFPFIIIAIYGVTIFRFPILCR